MNKITFISIVIGLTFASVANAENTTYASKKYTYYFQYPSSWENKADWTKTNYKSIINLTVDIFIIPVPVDDPASYAVRVGKYRDEAFSYTKTQAAALKRGYSQFISTFRKEYRESYGPSTEFPDNKVLSMTTAKTKIKDYTAIRIDTKIEFHPVYTINDVEYKPTIYGFDSYVFIRKGKGAVYYIYGSYSTTDSLVTKNPYASQFNALVKSFRIGKYTPPPAPLTISKVKAELSFNDVLISWTTDKNSAGKLVFGLDTSYGGTVNDTMTSKSHMVGFAAASGTTYHYKITACTTTTPQKCVSTSDRTYTVP